MARGTGSCRGAVRGVSPGARRAGDRRVGRNRRRRPCDRWLVARPCRHAGADAPCGGRCPLAAAAAVAVEPLPLRLVDVLDPHAGSRELVIQPTATELGAIDGDGNVLGLQAAPVRLEIVCPEPEVVEAGLAA